MIINMQIDEKDLKLILQNTFNFLSSNTSIHNSVIKSILIDNNSHKSLYTLLEKFPHLKDSLNELSENSELITLYSNFLINLKENPQESSLQNDFVFFSEYSDFSDTNIEPSQSIYSSFVNIHGVINKVCIKNISINCSIFNITSLNNTFYILKNNTDIREEFKLKIGYYTNLEIEAHMNAIFRNNNINCMLRYNKDLQRFSFGVFSDDKKCIEKLFLTESLSNLLGYSKNVFDISQDHIFSISDKKCSLDIFNNLYFQIYFNEIALPFYSTNSPLTWYSIMTNKYFYNQTVDFVQRSSLKTSHVFPSYIYIKVFDKNFNLIKDKISFSITFSFS